MQAIADWTRDNLGEYDHSIETGIQDAEALAVDTAHGCPHSKIVLAGYSQGAIVMHQVELRLGSRHRTAVLRRIAGSLLLGDGDRVPFTHAREFGSSLPRGEGVRTYLRLVHHDARQPARTAEICDAGDIVCDFNLSRLEHFSQAAKVHTSYAVKASRGWVFKPVLTTAAAWLASRIAGP